MKKTQFLQFLIILLITILTAQISLSQADSGTSNPQNMGLTDARGFELWMNNFIAEYSTVSTPSMGFVLIKGNDVFYQKGYGFADYEETVAVTPDQTVFRAASVSKLFTTTAIMQLVERGKIQLDADVNLYLKKFQLKSNYPAPVRVRDLLTHTSGIEDGFIGNSVPDAAQLPQLGDYFSQRVPRHIRPAGEEIAYSNRGMALAGHLVEAVSGLP